jgi:molybdopterin converting factor subunit 1
VRLFARLREIAGESELTRDVAPPATVRDVWDALARDVSGLAPYASSVSCAVNEEYARFTTAVQDGDEVAFLPPVSGGSSA